MKESRIRSFVRRAGRVTARQRRALENLWGDYVFELTDTLTLSDIFPTGPVTLEIGFGMGASLAEMAEQQPEMNFLGVEVHRPGVGSLLADIEERGLSNIRIICADIIDVLQRVITESSLDRILIFFPDPWHKKRHHKRRLVQPDFIRQLILLLKPNGILHMATDWENYAEHMQEVMQQFSDFKQLSSEADPRPETKFERRGLRLGHKVTDLVYKCC
jgi:tRNA (guanine-N7-)-methyltransferase